MKKVKQDKMIWKTTCLKILFALLFALSSNVSGQNLPSDDYYNKSLSQQEPSSELPSQKYYNKHLRSGEWEDDGGPGGSGEGSNQGVGVPLTGEVSSIMTGIFAYGIYIYMKRKKRVRIFK